MIEIDTDSAVKLFVKFDELHRDMAVGIREAVNQGVLMVQADVQRSIVEISGGKVYIRKPAKKGKRGYGKGSKTEIHIASKPGDAPNDDSGNLKRNIRASKTKGNTRKGYSATVKAVTPYAYDLEYGTSKMKPRPFMRPALAKNRKKIESLIINAVRAAL